MSRASTSSSAPRQLSLTEELEKLEQSITLTLQEIDSNFSRAHRIVSTSILPIVEQYSEHSQAVWEGSKFWKQFFEASSNVSLSSYGEQEQEIEDEDQSYTQTHDNTSAYDASLTQHEDNTLQHNGHEQDSFNQIDDTLLDNGDISGSTPRAPRSRTPEDTAQFAEYSSPYEALKSEVKGTSRKQDFTQLDPETPGARSRIPDMSMTPTSSPFDPTIYMQSIKKPNAGPLLHRMLDKSFRIHATPHTAQKQKEKTPANKPSWRDSDSPMSSPPIAAPQLRSEIFGSPIQQQYNRSTYTPRTPGISVQTPAKGKSKDLFPKKPVIAKKDEISWESDSDEDAEGVYREMGMSPPKTIQFNLPQSRLLQTPAREASKKIVEDLLTTAGAEYDDTLDDSPSMVGMKHDLEDSF